MICVLSLNVNMGILNVKILYSALFRFEILECGLYHEKKRYICMSSCGRNVLKTLRYDSVKCPALAVFAKSRARHVHVMSICMHQSLSLSLSLSLYLYICKKAVWIQISPKWYSGKSVTTVT